MSSAPTALRTPRTRHAAKPVTSSALISSPGFDGEQKDLLERWFDDHDRVTDATTDLDLVVRPEDVEGATPCHPEMCVISRAARRQYGSKACVVYGGIAYLVRPDEDGNERLTRYELTGKTLERREEFDRTGQHPANVAIRLRAPRGSKTLEAQRERGRRERAEGKVKKRTTSERTGKGPVVRSGQGCVITRVVSTGLAETDLRVGRE
jgi:hypothetical protein